MDFNDIRAKSFRVEFDMEYIKDFDSTLTKICEVKCLKSARFYSLTDSQIVDWVNKKSDGVKMVSGSEKGIML
jgi:hypothetical protein